MKILEKTITPNGIEIQLEDWIDRNTEKYSDLYGLAIGAYPIAKNTSKYKWVVRGEKFRLHIAANKFNYGNNDVQSDFEALKSGEKTLEDLSEHFWNGEKDKYFLGMILLTDDVDF